MKDRFSLEFIPDDDWLELREIERQEVRKYNALKIQRYEILETYRCRFGIVQLLRAIRDFDEQN